MASQIRIDINTLPTAGDSFSIRAYVGATDIQFINIEFVNSRSAIGESTITSNNTNCLIQLRSAIEQDYNLALLYAVSVDIIDNDNGTLVIDALNPQMEFEVISNTGEPEVSISLTNDAAEVFAFTEILGLEATSNPPCTHVKVSVESSFQADSIQSPISQAVASNPFIFEMPRVLGNILLRMTKDGEQYSVILICPQLLIGYFDFDVTTASNGQGSILITPQAGVFANPAQGYFNLVELEYSLDGVDWYGSNSFSGLAQGDYTLYIRDGLGCQITYDFTVEAFSANFVDYDPVAEISDINSLGHKCVEDVDGCGTFRNVKNTLSFEERTAINTRDFIQHWQQCDGDIRMQIKTNYGTVTQKLIDCDGNETDLNVVLKTNNMNRVDLRDAVTNYRYGLNNVWVFFLSGNVYDPDTEEVIGTYTTNGALPSFMNIGDSIFLEGFGWAQIVDTETHDGTELPPPFDTFITFAKTNGITAPGFYSFLQVIKVRSVYNIVDYERYETVLDISALDGDYYIETTFSDPVFGTKTLRSEWFNISEEYLEEHHVIDYYNSENNDINYSTGIQFRLRLRYILNLRYSPNVEQDLYVTDTNTILIENNGREFYEMLLRPLPTNMARKVVLALMHDRLQVDGMTYLLQAEPEVTRMGSTNLYKIKAQLVRSDYKFENKKGISINEVLLPDGDPLAIDENAQGLLFVN